MNLSARLGLVYLASEIVLRFARRSGRGAQRSDRGSLAALWVTILASIFVADVIAARVPAAHFGLTPLARDLAVGLFAAALLLRWWSILVLGKFFTVDVSIASDHRLIRRGPYRWMRHPSYTGMLLAFGAYGVILQNWVSLPCLLLPIALALAYRIRVEEAALMSAFGEEYHDYARATKRLIPGVC